MPMNANYTRLIKEEELAKTIKALELANADILTALKGKDETYQNKADLMKRARELETEIDLEEAEAIMKIKGESSRSQYVMIDGEKYPLTNDTARGAYMKSASRKQREELGKVQAELTRIEVGLDKANEQKYAVKELADNIRAKAGLLSNLLQYLSKG